MERTPEAGKLKEVPQMVRTGLSADYFNAFGWIISRIQRNERKEEKLSNRLAGKQVEKYRERFPDEEFKDVVTDKNRELITILDGHVDRLNELLKDDEIDTEEVLKIVAEMDRIVRGDDINA